MAGDTTAFHIRYAKHPTNDIAGVRYASVTFSSAVGEDPGEADAVGGPEKVAVQKQRIDVELYGTSPAALRALVGATAANLVLGHKAGSGDNEKDTIKNVAFTRFLGQLMFRDPDSGGDIPVFGVGGTAEWIDTDTLALMWLNAADA